MFPQFNFFSFNPFLCVLLFCMTFFRIADSPFFVSAKFPIYSECIIDFEIQMRPWTILDSIFFSRRFWLFTHALVWEIVEFGVANTWIITFIR